MRYADKEAGSYTGEEAELPPAAPPAKFAWVAYEVSHAVYGRRDDSLSVRKEARPLDTFREMPPDARDVQRLGERFGARYIMLLFTVSGTQQKGKTEWFEVRPGARVLGADTPQTYANAPRPSQSEDFDLRISRAVRAALGRGPTIPRASTGSHEPRRRTRSRDQGDGLVRELIEEGKRRYQADLERERERARELREIEQRHAEERRQLERKLEEERYKRLEEKVAESGSRKGEEPAPFDFKTVLGQAAVKAIERGDEGIAQNLLGTLKESEESAGGFWGFLSEVTREALDVVRENPARALELASTVLPGLAGAVGVPTAPQPEAPRQPEQPPATRQQLTDLQLITGLTTALANGVMSDADPAPYAQEVRLILEERPHLRESLEGLLQQTDGELLSTLSATARVSFDALGRTKPLKWAGDFRTALACYGIRATPAAPAPVDASTNGHAAAAQG